MVIGESTYLLLLGALLGERLFEVIISHLNARRAFARGAIEYGRGHFPVMVAMHALFIASCAFESLAVARAISPVLSTIALAGALIAQILRYSAVIALGEQWNTRIIVMPDAPKVTHGLYRWITHPNYLAVVIEIAAVPLIRGCWITAVAFSLANAVMLGVRIPAEERALQTLPEPEIGAIVPRDSK
jgi:methyltransferase